MPSLWFCVPAHGRAKLARICLRQLRRTCDALTANGVEATAVVIACDENLDTARELGFATVERDNQYLSRRFNDGIQLALDPDVNPRPADYVVPCGSDDWIDYRILLDLPASHQIHGFQRLSFVREDGREISQSFIDYVGGCGIRVFPRKVMSRVGYRPADEDRERACDTSILTNLRRAHENQQATLRVVHVQTDPRQIVDWKSPGEQLNGYADVRRYAKEQVRDPFDELRGFYPAEALREMRRHYSRPRRRSLVAA